MIAIVSIMNTRHDPNSEGSDKDFQDLFYHIKDQNNCECGRVYLTTRGSDFCNPIKYTYKRKVQKNSLKVKAFKRNYINNSFYKNVYDFVDDDQNNVEKVRFQ